MKGGRKDEIMRSGATEQSSSYQPGKPGGKKKEIKGATNISTVRIRTERKRNESETGRNDFHGEGFHADSNSERGALTAATE